MEYLDNLPEEQKQPLIDHFVQTILGKSTEPLILSKTITISNDASLEDRILFTAQLYNIDANSINKEIFVKGEKEIADSKSAINEIIKDHYKKVSIKGERNKDDELISVGKFLYTTQMNYTLTPSLLPDFILQNENERIGLEHTRLTSGKDRAYLSELWKKYLNGTINLILKEIPELTGVGNITLNADHIITEGKTLRDFKEASIKKITPEIQNSLANYILSQIRKTEIEKPDYITSFHFHDSNEAFTLKYNQDYFVRNDFTEIVLTAISEKENRLYSYKENSEFREVWLLLDYGDASLASGFKVKNDSLKSTINSSFDRIFILNSFNQACFEIKIGSNKLNYIAKKQFSELAINS